MCICQTGKRHIRKRELNIHHVCIEMQLLYSLCPHCGNLLHFDTFIAKFQCLLDAWIQLGISLRETDVFPWSNRHEHKQSICNSLKDVTTLKYSTYEARLFRHAQDYFLYVINRLTHWYPPACLKTHLQKTSSHYTGSMTQQ